MTMTMVERVARAIAAANGHDPDADVPMAISFDVRTGAQTPVAEKGSYKMWEGYRHQVSAAIQAMRTPTETMISVGGFAGTLKGTAVGEPAAADVWRAMIDAALDA